MPPSRPSVRRALASCEARVGRLLERGAQVSYRLIAVEHDHLWVARAERADTGKLYGIECAGASEREAIERLTAWLDWQQEHAAALGALQQAERAYHRCVAGSAFAHGTGEPSMLEKPSEALIAVERARVRLDTVRARRPE